MNYLTKRIQNSTKALLNETSREDEYIFFTSNSQYMR